MYGCLLPTLTLGMLVPNIGPLFSSDKVYLLIGGIGGLGVQIALWMYEVCAGSGDASGTLGS